ncbi:MAG: uracil-DNA glycosylase family protein, partial [Longimicrobiales bacterium]|nr:uracil-DNA glycosylase family protein [Longimicrobiales bacterium]
MTGRPSPEETARLLRQRLEMGAGEIFLDGLTREEALRLVAAALEGAEPRSSAPPSTSAAASSRPAGHASSGSRPSAPGPASTTEAPGSPSTSEPDAPLPDDYDALREMALGCTRCRLCEGRTQVVFSDGPRDARLMVVGEAPGANEDETGVPFVGAAGQYLDLLLSMVDLSREESVYIANVLKCRPPGNRDPKPDEIERCSPYLRKQIDLVRPQALLAVGSFSGKLLTGRDKTSLGKLRGEVHSYHGVPLVVTYHPAALLRNP